MSKKYTYEEVKQYIEDNSNCKLLSKEYTDSKTKLELQCNCEEKNKFTATFYNFKKRNHRTCRKCSIKRTADMKLLDFDEVKKYVEDNSDCSLVDLVREDRVCNLLLKCGCKEGHRFKTTFSLFKKSKKQCDKCSKVEFTRKVKHSYEYIKKIIEKDSNRKLLSNTYIKSRDKLLIQCECGNEFKTSFDNFCSKEKQQCDECTNEKIRKERANSYDYIKQYIEATGNKLLSKIYKNHNTKLEIQCRECGKTYYKTFYCFTIVTHKCCLQCAKQHSLGELEIIKFLDKLNINYVPQKTFEDCKHINKLPFDFYLPNKNVAIEFDGEFHYEVKKMGSMTQEQAEENFKKQQYRDAIKTNYCLDKGIHLIRIPYTQFNNIEQILTDKLL